ncbi:probable tRNA methyltransferase 9-like protein [Sinocyclocheilus grahami]|uniref:probable tRNA methyltransferase 9-like protein n=1 Tax=Sinocyclocheilus grahami TaxID=75366 RepID=UPI0007AC8DDA|nr:PREDICTED: probable tRNA methyltransferase 9-like protein [Sinocyclocheilus grahami]
MNTISSNCLVIHHMSTKERRIRAIKEMARTLRVGGRIMIYVWAMEQKRRKFEKQDIFVPWNPNPPLSPALRQRGNGTQSVSDGTASSDKHRKVKSTSSMVDEGDSIGPSQQKQQRLWFFSRSLDSVLDFTSLTVARSSSSTIQTPVEGESRSRRTSSRGLIRQMSSFFSSSSRTSLEEDIFISDPNEQVHKNDNRSSGNGNETASVELVHDCSSVPLPDLVSYQRDQSTLEGHVDGKSNLKEPLQSQESTASLLESDELKGRCSEQLKDSCLRYYHVFREGELTQLIQNHFDELHVLHSNLDNANWCVVAEKVQVWKV